MMKTQVKTPQEIADMRTSGRILAEILDVVSKACVPGINTQELDNIARQELHKREAQPAFLDYPGPVPFPATICISINDEIVHGVPGKDRTIRNGDLVGLDFGVSYNGMITDSAVTIGVGEISAPAKRLLRYTQQALYDAVDIMKPGIQVGDIGSTIEGVFDKGDIKGIYVMCGHGVGHELHEEPIIPNYGTAGTGAHLNAGMTVAIEPIASIGAHDGYVADDGWTFRTNDGSLAAQFEHTVLITEDGAEILTTI